MSGPAFDPSDREDWDENDWERFLRRADARTAKYQELFETLIHHPNRELLIAREMGWEREILECEGDPTQCPACWKRDTCEAYEMLRLMSEPEAIESDPDAEDLIASFEELRHIPAYVNAHDFALRVEDCISKRFPKWLEDDEARTTVFAAQMAPAQIAGGHGIGYERDSLCGNIANCKRALESLNSCLEQLQRIRRRGLIAMEDCADLGAEAGRLSVEIRRWIEDLRSRIWWR